jgi:hypothetical protein
VWRGGQKVKKKKSMSDSGILLLDTPISSPAAVDVASSRAAVGVAPAAVDGAFPQVKAHTPPTLTDQKLGSLSMVPLSASETWRVVVASGVRGVPFMLAVNPASLYPIIFDVLPPVVNNLTLPAAMHLARELFSTNAPSSAQITVCSEAQVFRGNTFVLIVGRAELWKSLKREYKFVSAARVVLDNTPLAVQVILRGVLSKMIVDEAERKKNYAVAAAAVTAALAFLTYQAYKKIKTTKE